jgi:hypothetical protein
VASASRPPRALVYGTGNAVVFRVAQLTSARFVVQFRSAPVIRSATSMGFGGPLARGAGETSRLNIPPQLHKVASRGETLRTTARTSARVVFQMCQLHLIRSGSMPASFSNVEVGSHVLSFRPRQTRARAAPCQVSREGGRVRNNKLHHRPKSLGHMATRQAVAWVSGARASCA